MAELEPQFVETVEISALELRSAFAPLQAGVYAAGDLKVTAGAGRTVDVAAGIAFVRGSATDQGLYRGRNDATKNSDQFSTGGITANGSGNPRIDQIIARALDHTHDGSGLRLWRLEVVTGAASAGATLDNRTGAVSDGTIGGSWVRLADVLVPAGAATILAANIRDRRPWSRGAYRRIVRNANAAAGNDYTTTSTSAVIVDATNIAPRIECSGVPIRLKLASQAFHSAASGWIRPQLRMDGAQIDGGQEHTDPSWTAGTLGQGLLTEWDLVPAAGSHVFAPYYYTNAGTATLLARATQPLQFIVEELVRQNADNT